MKSIQLISALILCIICVAPIASHGQGFQEVYENIAVFSYGDQHQLEVFPGGDAGQVRFSYKNTDLIKVRKDGSLKIKTGKEIRIEKAVIAYQEGVNGEKSRVEVQYKVRNNTVMLDFGEYEMAQVLVVELPGLSHQDFDFVHRGIDGGSENTTTYAVNY